MCTIDELKRAYPVVSMQFLHISYDRCTAATAHTVMFYVIPNTSVENDVLLPCIACIRTWVVDLQLSSCHHLPSGPRLVMAYMNRREVT